MLRVGLTGGIACGKSHVARRLAGHGFQVLDLDAVAHELTAPGGAAYDDVVAEFGRGILAPDGRIDRRRLAGRVFADAAALARLNALVHPHVHAAEARRAEALGGSAGVLVTEAALLVETGLHLRFDRLLVVTCEADEQVRRLAARDGMSEEAARARMAAQMPLAEKRRFAHHVIDSSQPLARTDRATDAIAQALRRLAAVPVPAPPLAAERALGAFVHGPAHGPRGLTPALVLREIVRARGPEMERLAAHLAPPAPGPWYRAAEAGTDVGPETLAAPAALWALARRGGDPEYAAAVAAAIAWLTHRAAVAIGDAVALAVALVLTAGGGLEEARGRWLETAALAERWAGARPGGRAEAALGAALRHPRDPVAARASLGEPAGALAGALAGMAAGLAGATAPDELAADVAALTD
jgi:dephospho-CoA kinase